MVICCFTARCVLFDRVSEFVSNVMWRPGTRSGINIYTRLIRMPYNA